MDSTETARVLFFRRRVSSLKELIIRNIDPQDQNHEAECLRSRYLRGRLDEAELALAVEKGEVSLMEEV